jgi:CHASE2 domain
MNKQRIVQSLKKVRFLWLLVYLSIALCAPLVEHLLEDNDLACGYFGHVARVTYRILSSLGYRKPRAHYVYLVSIQAGEDPGRVVTDGCERRRYLTKLITTLAREQPAVIVLDFSPNPLGVCPQTTDSSLQTAISETSKVVPMVVGEGPLSEDEILKSDARSEMPALRQCGFGKTDLLLRDSGWITNAPSTSGASYGLTEYLCDNRTLPVNWTVFVRSVDPPAKYERRTMDTLSVAAAKAYEGSDIPMALISAQPHQRAPLISFLQPESFPRTPAIELLCKDGANTRDWEHCQEPDILSKKIRARIVVIGLGDNPMGSDSINSVLGKVQGYILQANYIEALLDDRLLWQPSKVVISICSLTLTGLIYGIFALAKGPGRALFAASLLVVACALLCMVLALEGGWYLDFWVPGIAVCVLNFVERVREKAREHTSDVLPSQHQAY